MAEIGSTKRKLSSGSLLSESPSQTSPALLRSKDIASDEGEDLDDTYGGFFEEEIADTRSVNSQLTSSPPPFVVAVRTRGAPEDPEGEGDAATVLDMTDGDVADEEQQTVPGGAVVPQLQVRTFK